MRICPNCRTEYTDDGLQYCLQDGTPLIDAPFQTTNFDSESETVVSPKQVEPIRFEPPSSYRTNRTERQTNQPFSAPPESKKPNTAATVVLSVLGTLIVLGLIGAGVYFYANSRRTAVVANANIVAANRPPNVVVNQNTNANSNTNANANLNANLASPSPTPTAQPTINPEQAKRVSDDVKDVVKDWKDASENLDITRHLSDYADTVDYYRAGKVGIAKVRADREKAFADYDSIGLDIDNLRVIPDPTGEKATAIFDKAWRFEGTDKTSEGRVQQQLTFTKINGRWLISGEKDLKVYYKN